MLRFVKSPALWLMLLALVVRAALFRPEMSYDSWRFRTQAQWLAEGKGFLSLGGAQCADPPPGDPCTGLPPGYPVFLAIVSVVSDSVRVLLGLNLLMSMASCWLVYAAIKPRSPRAALVALFCIAVSPVLVRYVGHVTSETFGTFLTSVLVFLLSRLETSGAGAWLSLSIGLVCVAILLTVPATIFLCFFVWCYVAWRVRRHPGKLLALAAGSLLLMVPWQIHCCRATGHVQPTVFSQLPFARSGVLLWFRTWGAHWQDGGVFWSDERFEQIPDSVFSSKSQREELTALRRKVVRREVPNWNAVEVDQAFRRAARERIEADPWRFYVVLPVRRSISLWFQPRYAWERGAALLDRVPGFDLRTEDAGSPYDAAGILAGTLGFLAWHAIPLLLLLLTAYTFYRPRPMPLAIVCGVAAYTLISSALFGGAFRRNVPFFPPILFMLFYLYTDKVKAIASSCVVQAENGPE